MRACSGTRRSGNGELLLIQCLCFFLFFFLARGGGLEKEEGEDLHNTGLTNVLRLITVQKTDTGETFEEEADVVVAARGALNEFKWPDIPGLKRFKGEMMHSAAWNQE